MKKLQWLVGSIMLGAALMFGFSNMIFIVGETYSESRESSTLFTKNNDLYKEECGSCHMAYPADLLPQKSWGKIMNDLENHFDENAELDTETDNLLKAYLSLYALGSKKSRKANKMLRNFPKNQTPLRITKLPYFTSKHGEIPSRLVKYNPKVVSFSQCQKCHKEAESGNFNEHQVKIPGYGRWED